MTTTSTSAVCRRFSRLQLDASASDDGDRVRRHSDVDSAERVSIELLSDAGARPGCCFVRNEHDLAELAVPILVDRRRTGERGGVGRRRERTPLGERAPEVEADPAEEKQHEAEAEHPERDRPPLVAVVRHGSAGHHALT